MADRFMFFENFKLTAENLPDEVRLKFYDGLVRYVFDGTEPEDPIVKALITAIKPSLDKEETRGGLRPGSGRPKSNENQTEIKNNQKNQNGFLICDEESKEIKNNQNEKNENQKNQSFLETETETETETGRVTPLYPPSGTSERGAKRFVRPSVDEVRAYCEERGNGINAEDFVNFYEAKGWVVGKSPMKDWKAAVRTWEGKRARVVKAEPEPEPFFWDNQLNCGEVDGVAYYAWTDYYEAVKAFREKKGA